MDRFARVLIGCLLALMGSSAFAGFADAAPPVGWSSGGGPGGSYNFSRKVGEAANTVYNNVHHIRSTASVVAAGQATQVPAAMRLAANAGSFAAGKSLHPGLLLGALALPYIIQWAQDRDITMGDAADAPGGKAWFKNTKMSGGTGFRVHQTTLFQGVVVPQGAIFPTAQAALDDFIARANLLYPGFQANSVRFRGWDSATVAGVGWYPWGSLYSTASVTMTPATEPEVWSQRRLTDQEFQTEMTPVPIPPQMPQATPWDWPIELPRINPNPYPDGSPQELIIPTGNPVWDPARQKWFQPAIKVIPSPTTSNPWRVDYRPIEIELPSPNPANPPSPNAPPNPVPQPYPDPFRPNWYPQPGQPFDPYAPNPNAPNPNPNPLAPPPNPNPNPNPNPAPVPNPNSPGAPQGGSETPKEETVQLCEAFPDVLACQKLGTASPTPVQNTERSLAITKEEGFGPSNGSCPADRDITLSTFSLKLSYQPICTAAEMLRPVVLALAYLSAALTFMGLGRKE